MLSSMAPLSVLKTLSSYIRDYLMDTLVVCIKKVRVLKRYLIYDQIQYVHDVINCGPRNRFVALGDRPTILHNCLSGDYGAGAKAKWRKCLLQGIKITLDEMRDIHAAQLELHSGVTEYKQELEREWNRRGGWVLSGLGFPTPVHVDFIKDLGNRVVQRTGHDVHVLCVWLLHSMLSNEGVYTTGVVWDFHDQFIYQAPASQSDTAIFITASSIAELNQFLGGDVRLKCEPRLVNSLSEAKMEEAFNERAAKG